ncbi:MAG: 23S rRNA (adenine(2030)-N(6))-methyltransferase RlmJ [Hahellaceae bacterium]|nr:23S rRNA (adenine(2030)-N(6))-methyltransferase RlmJ [Hahellaceae bacterium]MCP5168462.1 23S rRNA (adenine(2030)-N(6))-methyltransferase RlmJ [Hahellaceae bacterium]
MLSYQHGFHAGNFADVHKHLILLELVEYLLRKDKPICYIDTHAGRGLYDLESVQAQKTEEFSQGIGRLWLRNDLSALLNTYRNLVDEINPGDRLTFYPGSPAILANCLRDQDKLILLELHPTEFSALQVNLRDPRIAIHQRDAWEGLQALTPPPIKRGLVLIDPSYEVKQDYSQLPKQVIAAAKKWSTATWAIWYPLLPAGKHEEMLKKFKESGLRKILRLELMVKPATGTLGMYGSGMLIINPTWNLCEDAGAIQDELVRLLEESPASGSQLTEWLVPE